MLDNINVLLLVAFVSAILIVDFDIVLYAIIFYALLLIFNIDPVISVFMLLVSLKLVISLNNLLSEYLID
ncbi:hypothetical protein [Turkeypox virus]|uniref:Uncharacterized protein n=1 Tax=Turkeypox virus TaxID=336486 RepID=A0A0M3ZHG8_9POXV|nr:hypothetical protein ASN15_gp049 [Turkeypox virus]ALA62423.1 hypothetical protein [Turkeypox virus]UWS64484.1 hypothetical protein [Avipoxvirus sp.]